VTGDPIGTKNNPKRISYNVKLFFDNDAWERRGKKSLFSIEKISGNRNSQVIFPSQTPREGSSSVSLDLFSITDGDLRLIVEDNTANGDPETKEKCLSRDKYYHTHNLTEDLDTFVPFHIEVRKHVGTSTKVTEPVKDDEVNIVFEFTDPSEETANIKGPEHKKNSSPRTGRKFIENFILGVKNAQSGVKDDNCIDEFASNIFGLKCRKLGEHIKASKILYYESRNGLRQPLQSDSSLKETYAKMKVAASKEKGHLEGIASFLFNPAIVLGDNYILKVTVTDSDNKPMVLNDGHGKKVVDFHTPKITIWKRVRIHMLIQQHEMNYEDIKWNEVKNAYRDAFIIIEEPLRKIKIPVEDWMKYLEKTAYRVYQNVNWEKYKKEYEKDPKRRIIRRQFGKFSFPQKDSRIDGSENLTPKDELNEEFPTWNTCDLLSELAINIIKNKLENDTAKVGDNLGRLKWDLFRDPTKSKKYGICVLVCRRPSENSIFGGGHVGGKIIFLVQNGDLTRALVHELGHALFLHHGITSECELFTTNAKGKLADAPIACRSNKPGEVGPYYYEHDSDDMVSCVMSYGSDYYNVKGKKLLDSAKNLLEKNDHPVDWHFCGVCLLKLRFYEPTKMQTASNSIFRELQYSKEPITIANLSGDYFKDQPSGKLVLEINTSRSIELIEGRNEMLFALYPKEGVRNNRNWDLYKDVSYLSEPNVPGNPFRGRWDYPDEFKLSVRVSGETLKNSWIHAKISSLNDITFRIKISEFKERSSNRLLVRIKPIPMDLPTMGRGKVRGLVE
jgi:hypothetical protein